MNGSKNIKYIQYAIKTENNLRNYLILTCSAVCLTFCFRATENPRLGIIGLTYQLFSSSCFAAVLEL